MKIEKNATYPHAIRVDPVKESYTIKKDYYRKNAYNMSKQRYHKMFFAGEATMKTVMRIMNFPKNSEIRIIDGAEEGTPCYNRHMVISLFHRGEKYRVGLWAYSSGEIDMWVTENATGEKTYHQFHTQNTKEFVKLARRVRNTYLK